MDFIRSLLVLVLTFMPCPSYQLNLPTSTISAAPAVLPEAPLSSPPTLSPDISPLFPSPGGSELSPSQSSVPIIPSSPSPPNPDAMVAPGPFMAFSPSGSLPASSAIPRNVSETLSLVMGLGLLGFWLIQFFGV
ncbi:unnamed protein product [Ilex paraguariensis]|uniref:Uncharacterized protein n=1 Tax=Ilex paraguariensis TaxID=185542 RepID=A0ABC8U8J0_9AQUA